MGVNDSREQWCFTLCHPRSLIEWRMRIKILLPFWKIVLMSKKGERNSQKKKGFVKSTKVRKLQRYMDEVKIWEDSRLPLDGGCMR
jgi:hypothetical protein